MSDDFKRGIKLMSQRELNLKTNEKKETRQITPSSNHEKFRAMLFLLFFFGINQFTTVSIAAGFTSSENILWRKINRKRRFAHTKLIHTNFPPLDVTCPLASRPTVFKRSPPRNQTSRSSAYLGGVTRLAN